jgi:hypothetical protein
MEYFIITQFQIFENFHYDLFFDMNYLEMYVLISSHVDLLVSVEFEHNFIEDREHV